MQELLWDKLMSWNAWIRDDITLPRLRRAGYAVVGLTVGGGMGGATAVHATIDAISRALEDHPEFLLVRNLADVDTAMREGRLGLELNFQGIEPLEGNLRAVEYFHCLGIRQMGILWNADNEAGCSCTSDIDTGLTQFGRQLIAEMNRVGVVVDGSHAGYRTTMDAMAMCNAPFVFSHGNIDAIKLSYKNLKDDQIRSCAETRGVIGISGFGTYLEDLQASAESMYRQIDYVCELVGAQHAGIGLDFVSNPEPLWEKVRTNPQLWPGVEESRFFPPEEISTLKSLMEKAGYTDQDISGILGENWKRVHEEIEQRGVDSVKAVN
jgi:membrane dipeptidase